MAPTTPATSSSSCASGTLRDFVCRGSEVRCSAPVCARLPPSRRGPGSLVPSIKGAEFVRLFNEGRPRTFPTPLSVCLLPLRWPSYTWLLFAFSFLSLLLWASLLAELDLELRLDSRAELDVGMLVEDFSPSYKPRFDSSNAVQRARQQKGSQISMPMCHTTRK